MKKTINEALALQKAVVGRLQELRGLRNQVSVKETWLMESRKQTEPQYDVKAVDKKITTLEMWLFKTDAAIKQSNAFTTIDLTGEVEIVI